MAAEAYRALRTNLSYVSPAKPPRVIVVTSALSGDGKTTSASNLAVTLAQQNKRVLLIDAETRRGNMHTLFGIEATPGFFDLLYGQATPGECIRRVALEGTGHLDVLPSGGMPNANAADLLVASRLAPFFERLRMQYDYVLIDTPPLNLFTDAALIGAHADATLLVARADRTERQALQVRGAAAPARAGQPRGRDPQRRGPAPQLALSRRLRFRPLRRVLQLGADATAMRRSRHSLAWRVGRAIESATASRPLIRRTGPAWAFGAARPRRRARLRARRARGARS